MQSAVYPAGVPWTRLLVAIGATASVALVVGLLPLHLVPQLAVLAGVTSACAALTFRIPRALVVVGASAYVVLLNWVYLDWVVPVYAYSGLFGKAPEWDDIAVTAALGVLPSLWLATSLRRPSDIVLWFLYLFGYVPAILIPIHLLGPSLTAVLPLSLVLVLSFAVLAVVPRLPLPRVDWNGLNDQTYIRLLLALGLGSVAYLIVVFGVPIGLPAFETVYDTREAYASVASASPGAGYLVPWAGNVIFPLIVAFGLASGRRSLFGLGSVGALLVYGTTGFKTVLFSIALVPLLYVIIRWFPSRLGAVLTWGAVAVVGLSVAATWVTGSIWPLALFVTRLLAVPGQMTAYYYDFFTTHDTYLLSRSFLRWFIESPYDVDPPFLIGAVYLHSPSTDANANVWADAIANFGLAGVIPFTIVMVVVLWVLDSVTRRRSLLVVGPTLGLMGITLGNGALFTTILTLGLGLLIALSALLPPSDSPGSDLRATPSP